MRSSNSKPGKSVSICNDAYPNGPSSKKEGEDADSEVDGACIESENNGTPHDADEERVHALASKVVEDVVRIASIAASERKAETSSSSSAVQSQLESTASPETNSNPNLATLSEDISTALSKAEKLKRLPTIQIDTVPSIPSSPTEWQSPTKEDVIIEEEEEVLDEDYIDLFFDSPLEESKAKTPSEIQEFASSYIKDIIIKAMDIAEEKQKIKDAEVAKEIAAKVVEDVIAQANDKAFEKLAEGLSFPENVPSIQIDTVPSIPPSPTWDEEEEQKQQNDTQSKTETVSRKKSKQFIFRDDEDEVKVKAQPKVRKLVKHSEAPTEIREFATCYVKDIISKAITMAEEKLVSSVPFNFEDVDLIKVSNPWYIRAREALMRVLRSACFCTPRRHDS